MSGIVGIYFLDGRPVDRMVLERMTESIAHRGRDGSCMWNRGPIGLGHRMLWTTPESLHEHLPLVNKTGNFVLTADARIDNRDELMAAFGLTGHPEGGISDSELILSGYEQWGERCPEKLVGDFAFAIWDEHRQQLFLARDHFGVKPFYYYRSGRVFVFASEIKALFCVPEVPKRLNEVRVADYLVPMLEDETITFYRDIFRLPSAHTMTVTCNGIKTQCYWSLDPSRQVRLRSDEEYAETFRDLFTEAVRCRLRSAFPMGSLLSGGLDSSSIVCVMQKICAQDGAGLFHTFSAIFGDVPEGDERPFINAVLAQGGVEPHYFRADRLSPLTDLDRVLWHEDEPFYAPNLFVHWGSYNVAQQQDVRVLLDGFDGDTTVSYGITYLTELARTGRWKALITEVMGLSRNFNVSPWKVLWRRGLRPLAPKPVRQAWRALRGRNGPAWMTQNPTIHPDFARRIGLAERFKALQGERFKPARSAREDHWRRLTRGLTPFVLELADKAAMAFSIEPRYPFFDRRLVEFCLALPPEQKIHQGWTRMVLRRAMVDILPVEVQWRGDKFNFSANFNRGLLTVDRELVEEVTLNDPSVIAEYVNIAALHKTYNRCLSQPKNEDTMTVWKAVSLALWLRRTGLTP
ncbi:MAG: lasso peptide isopeptide bond-forming cyclase [Candidatus Binatia bacterium]